MATIIPAGDILGDMGDGLAYVGAEEKAKLHEEQLPFFIVSAIAEAEGQYGPQTIFTIRRKGLDNARLAFGVSDQRRELAQKVSVAIANGADAIGPFYLGRWENGTRSGWTLTPEPTQAKTIPPSPAREDAEKREIGTATDDDLPF
jgi:hypothetical protein